MGFIHDVEQGTDPWLALRAKCDTASEASIAMGQGKITRAELVRMKSTGAEQEYSQWVLEVLFAKGHEVEELARPIAEEYIGEELYPVTMTAPAGDLELLASMDGRTMSGMVAWECKQWNAKKVADVNAGILPLVDYWQVIQQIYVSGADRLVYTVSDGTPENTVHLEVTDEQFPIAADIETLIASWQLLREEVAAYNPDKSLAVIGADIEELPALLVKVSGDVTESNMAAFNHAAREKFASINRNLNTDQDFADAEKAIKWCAGVEGKIDYIREQVLAQTASIDELLKGLDLIKCMGRDTRLDLTKGVKKRKDEIRGEILVRGREAFVELLAEANADIGGGASVSVRVDVDFAGVMKGKRTVDTLNKAVDDELARAKVEAYRQGRELRAALKIIAEHGEGLEFLFRDTAELVRKTPDDLRNTIKVRKMEYSEAERIKAEKIEQEKAQAAQVAEEKPHSPAPEKEEKAGKTPIVETPVDQPKINPCERITRRGVVSLVSAHYGCTEGEAEARLLAEFS